MNNFKDLMRDGDAKQLVRAANELEDAAFVLRHRARQLCALVDLVQWLDDSKQERNREPWAMTHHDSGN